MTDCSLLWNNQSSSLPRTVLSGPSYFFDQMVTLTIWLFLQPFLTAPPETNYSVHTQQLPGLSPKSHAVCIPVSSFYLQKSFSKSSSLLANKWAQCRCTLTDTQLWQFDLHLGKSKTNLFWSKTVFRREGFHVTILRHSFGICLDMWYSKELKTE